MTTLGGWQYFSIIHSRLEVTSFTRTTPQQKADTDKSESVRMFNEIHMKTRSRYVFTVCRIDQDVFVEPQRPLLCTFRLENFQYTRVPFSAVFDSSHTTLPAQWLSLFFYTFI